MDVDAQPKNSEPLFLFDDDSDVEFVGADRGQEAQEASDYAMVEPTSEPELNVSNKPSRKRGTFDLEAYQKESLARHQRELNKTRKSIVISDSGPTSSQPAQTPDTQQDSSAAKKARQKPVRLDEGLLLSSKGFQQLIKHTKDFKIKGKGHEVTDLNRLLQIYQFWTHQLHPKTQFRDTVSRIEKLCHSRRMLSALSVWRDEAHGKLDTDGQLSGDDHNEDLEAQAHDQVSTPSANVPPSSPSSRAASHPPTSDVESEPSNAVDELPDDDMDALIQEYSKQPHEEIWDDDPSVLDEYFTSAAPPPVPVPSADVPMADATEGSTMAEEEEDWGEDMYI
ncbi:Replication Fork Protection Component Swi3 domain containing protein [Amanita muscaria]